VRAALPVDSTFLFDLRNDPEVRRWSRNKAVISRREHDRWFQVALRRDAIFVDEWGMVRIAPGGEVSIAVTKLERGHGVGEKLLTEALRRDGRSRYLANIHKWNVPSLVTFLKAGFVPFAMNGSWLSMRRMRG
jgi:GNAT superfamily N-acetyltransferase